MLEQWLEPDSVNFFLKHHLCKRQPFAKPQAAQSSTWIFKWNILDRLLANCAADTLAISRGKVVERLIPRDLSETRSLLGDGIGLVIRHAEQLDSALADLAHSLTETVPGKAHIQLFVTPAGTYGFSWHYDREEVFVVQTEGIKDYFFRENTVELRKDAAPDFTRFRDEVSPMGSVRLIEGDWLYIPTPWWHVAKCIEDSLSISIGVSPDESWLAAIKVAD
jgi:ribosomal protein L16 Arg81 hydroxylase